MIDLGTLGGNTARPNDLNDQGQIVGVSLTSAGATHAFVWEGGTIRDLGTLGAEGSEAHLINNAGLIAGEVWTGTGWDERANSAATWSGTSGRIIQSDGDNCARATGITMSGDIVGIRCGHEEFYGWLWRNEQWLSLPGVYYSTEWRPTDMNERGQFVGGTPTHAWGESRILHAFLFEADSMRDIGVLAHGTGWCDFDDDCSSANALDINEQGQVVGWSTDAVGKRHFVLWENGTIRDLGLIPSDTAYRSERIFINNAGQIFATAAGQGLYWRGGSWHSIGSLGGATEVVAVNEGGLVVGYAETASGEPHVFIWTEAGGMVDLGSGPPPFTAAWAIGVNARGDIIGLAAPCQSNYNRTCAQPRVGRAILWRKQ